MQPDDTTTVAVQPIPTWFESTKSWTLDSMGLGYAIAIPAVGVLVLVGAVWVSLRNTRPSVWAAYLPTVTLPALIGVIGMFFRAVEVLDLIANACSPPRAPDYAIGISSCVCFLIVGLLSAAPSFLVITLKLADWALGSSDADWNDSDQRQGD